MKTTVQLFGTTCQNMATVHIRFPLPDDGMISVENSSKPYYNYDYDQRFTLSPNRDEGRRGRRMFSINLHSERIQLSRQIVPSKKTVKVQTKEVKL